MTVTMKGTSPMFDVSFVQAPDLDIDRVLYASKKVPPRIRRERRIVWNMFRHLAAEGFVPITVGYGDEEEQATTAKGAMEIVFNLDHCRVYFDHPAGCGGGWVRLVGGNDLEIISDWSSRTKLFDQAMHSFVDNIDRLA